MKKKVALGLSGGVDSALSAALLVEQGYDVTGVFMECYNEPGCRTDGDHKDALEVALQLSIPFEVVDFRAPYKKKVLDYFVKEYKSGRTPNPDVVCNREIKFGLFYDEMMERGFGFVATGHYAKVSAPRSTLHASSWQLLRGADEKKDQSYFLHLLREEQLEHILFPVGHLTKKEVRDEAKKRGLVVAEKPDSQGICFIGEVPAYTFLKKMGVKEEVGEVVNVKGEVVGTHKGVWFYTIGQRKGFTIYDLRFTKNNQRPPMFVVGKEVEKNQLVVGTRKEAMRESFEVEKVHVINDDLRYTIYDMRDVKVRIRHGGEMIGAKYEVRGTKYVIQLEKPVFGVASGQAAVFYQDEVCLGGGTIV